MGAIFTQTITEGISLYKNHHIPTMSPKTLLKISKTLNHIYVCLQGYAHVGASVHGSQKRVPEPQALGLEMVSSHQHGFWEQRWEPLGEQYVLFTTEPSH